MVFGFLGCTVFVGHSFDMSHSDLKTLREKIRDEKYYNNSFFVPKFRVFKCMCGKDYLSKVGVYEQPEMSECIWCRHNPLDPELYYDALVEIVESFMEKSESA